MRYIERSIKIFLVLAAVVLLYLSSLYNYLLFHSLAEVFSICIAVSVFLVTWNSARFIKNKYLLVVGFAYLFIGFLDLIHTISYKGMAIFTDYDYHANQLWVAARYFESIVLLLSFILIKSKKRINTYLLLGIYTVITTLIMLSVFVWHIFPVCFVEGVGQTPFKIISEYIIIAILLSAVFILSKNRDAFDKKVYMFLIFSLMCTIASEFCFTTYVSNYGFANLLGHYFKISSFYFIYRTIIQTGIREPYDLIFREMKQTEQQLYDQNQSLSNKTIADGLTIKEHMALLQQQYNVLNRQAKLLDLSNEAIFVWDLNGTILYWNRGAELMYGYTSEEAVGRTSDELLKTIRPASLEETSRVLDRKGIWNGELEHTTKNGKVLFVDSTHQMYGDEDGRKIILEICRDITERKKMEADIRYQNVLLYAVIENMHDALFVYNREGNITSINARAREMYQDHFTEQTTAENVFENYRCLDLERNPLPLEAYPTRRAFRGESINNERVIMEGEHWSRIIEVNATPIVDAHDEILAIVVCHHDITELMQKQQAIGEHIIQLQQQNKILNRQAKLLDLSHEAIFAWYMDGPIIYWNQGAIKMYGYGDDDAIGCLPHTLLNSKFPFSYSELKANLLEHGSWSGLIEHTTKDGRSLCMETRLQIIINEFGLNTVLETNRDVTDRIKAENEIKKNAQELQNIIDSTDDFIWSVDADYRIIFCNKSVNEYTQKHYGVEFKPGLSFAEIFPNEVASSFQEFYERVKQEGEFHIDVHTFRGSKFITYYFHPIYVDSELVEITVFGRDITERITAEHEIIKLNTSLEARINERTEELQQTIETLHNFSRTMTHDLKTPLHEIDKRVKQIQNNIDKELNTEKIIELTSKMNSMITELLDYERISRSEIKKEAVDIGKMFVSIFEEQKTDHAVLDFQTGMPKVCADKSLIRHVVMNVLSNALKFSSNREVSKIIVGCSKENNEYIFSIKDNGIGIDMEYADKLFNAFERLHSSDEFEGHGIGLAIVKNIITKHGGRTWINGRVNIGTTVCFTLPIDSVEEN